MPLTLRDATPELLALVDPEQELQELAAGFGFIEGPAWSRWDHGLLFSDILTDTRWRWSPERGAEVAMHPNYKANGLCFEADGSLLACEHVTSSVIRIRPNGDRQLVAFHYRGAYLNSPNDVVVSSDGAIYFSDPDYGRWDHPVGVARPFELGFHGVYRVPPGGGETELVVERDAFDQPNGLCFSPDESRLFVNDLTCIRVYDVRPDGSLAGGDLFHDGLGDTDIPGRGNPDGMKVDERGNVWCTARGGVWVLSPAGALLGVIETPETVANIAWGGPGWRTLFLCTSTTLRAIQTRVASTPLPHHADPQTP
jgi:gluconolactonase